MSSLSVGFSPSRFLNHCRDVYNLQTGLRAHTTHMTLHQTCAAWPSQFNPTRFLRVLVLFAKNWASGVQMLSPPRFKQMFCYTTSGQMTFNMIHLYITALNCRGCASGRFRDLRVWASAIRLWRHYKQNTTFSAVCPDGGAGGKLTPLHRSDSIQAHLMGFCCPEFCLNLSGSALSQLLTNWTL